MNEWLMEIVREAGQIAEEYQVRGFTVKYKEDGSIVTSADLHIDQFIREQIQERFPEDGILTEESVDDPGRLSWRRVWIVDPIDGTAAFADKRPEFGILVALCVDGDSVETVAHFPLMGVTLYANVDQGVFVNGRRVQVSKVTGEPYKVAAGKGPFEALHTAPAPVRNNALALFQVITGEIEGCVISCGAGAGEHDYAWASCALDAAGGRMTDAHGEPLRYNKDDRRMPPVIVGSNGLVHDDLLRQVNR